MYTFSQLVDEIVSETKRPDLVSDISRYLNQTIRELHFTEDRNAALKYIENYKETTLLTTTESGQQWEIPDPTRFQGLSGARYDNVFDDDGNPVWARETTPGRHLNQYREFTYRVGGSYVFAGYGGIGATISLAWFDFPPGLKYKSAGARPASYDVESGWTYAAGIVTDEEKLGAQLLTSNWLLMRWNDVLAEGLRAKVFKRVSDDSRSRTSYSLYQSLRHGLWTSETMVSYGG